MLLLAVGVERLTDRDGDVDPDQIDQGQRTHRIVGAQGHAPIDVLRRHPGLLHQSHSVEEVREEQPVDHEARLIRDLDDGLADRLAPGARARRDLGARGVGNAELDQLHPRHRVEGVQAEDALRVAGP